MLFLLSIWIFTVLAEKPPVQHYQLKHSSVCLHVDKASSIELARWKFEDTFLTVKDKVHPNHTDKVDFNPDNLTLCIKNLTNADSGIYKMSYMYNFDEKSVVHQVIVEEMVPKPVMTVMQEDRSNLSAASCRIRVNCSIQDDWLWSICDEDGCTTPQESFSKLNISIFFDNSTVVCRGNNHVSTNMSSVSIATKCFMKSGPEDEEESKPSYNTIIILCVIFCGACIIFTYILISKPCNSNQATSAALLIQNGQLERQRRSEPRTSTSSSGSEAEPSYENVDTPRLGESIVPGAGQDFREGQRVDTIYSIPQAPATRVKYERTKDTSVNRDEQTTSESATQNQDQSLTQVDTVYTLLQMPKDLKSQHDQEGD